MVRPKKPRKVSFDPKVTYFKPRSVPLANLEEECLSVEEIEALRIYDLQGKSQTKVAEQMEVSQSTVGRILKEAHKKIVKALINGEAIKIKKD
ncbi:MAG: DUF134 domain-containing protein [Candidatus Paceibacterota bacterium]